MVGMTVNNNAAKHVGVSIKTWNFESNNVFQSSLNVEGFLPALRS